MFDGPDFPGTLDNELFAQWLENGRLSKISYSYLLVVWDELESAYKPVYAERRDEIEKYEMYRESTGNEALVAAYDLYSESKIK